MPCWCLLTFQCQISWNLRHSMQRYNLCLRLSVALDTTLCDKVCQWLATGWWFSPDSSTNQTCRHNISTIFQLYRGGEFYLVEETRVPGETTDLSQVTDKFYHILLYTSPWSRFELTASVVIRTDCIGSCKSNYHTITATTAPSQHSVSHQ